MVCPRNVDFICVMSWYIIYGMLSIYLRPSLVNIPTDWGLMIVTHRGRIMYICISKLCQQWFRSCLVVCSPPNDYQNQCWFIANWTIAKKNFSDMGIQIKFALQKTILKMSAKWWPFCLGLIETNWQLIGPFLLTWNNPNLRLDK